MPIPRRYKETSLFQKGAIANAINEEVLSAESRINITTDNIISEVSKITSAKYVNSSTSGWTLANIKTYAAEGHSEIWNVSSATPTTDFRVGDIIYVKGTDTTRNCPVYIKTSVTAINSSTQFVGVSHGYEDILPINSIKSTINQSADSVKIEAKHVDIEGAAIFKSGGAYDKSKTVVRTETQWYSSNSPTETDDGAWTTDQPNVNAGRYIWQREKVTYANGAIEYKPSEDGVCIQGQTDLSAYSTTIQMNTAIGDAVNDIAIGGRNLLLKTGILESKAMPAVAAGSYTTWDPYTLVEQYSNLNLKEGDSITISFDWNVANAAANSTVKVGTNVSPWEYFGVLITFASGNSSGHAEKTFKITSALASCTGTKLRLRIDAVGAAITTGMILTLKNVKLEKGNKATDWSPAPEDVDSAINSVQDTASKAAPKTDAIKRTQRIYYRNNINTVPTAPTSAAGAGTSKWVTSSSMTWNNGNTYDTTINASNVNGVVNGGWTTNPGRLTQASNGTGDKYDYLYTCIQKETVAGVVTCDQVLIDETDTVIDGGKIITGSVTANQIAANSITTNKLTVTDLTNYCQLNRNTAAQYDWAIIEDSSNPNTPWFQRKTLARDNYPSEWFDCKGGESFKVSMSVSSTVTGAAASGGTAGIYMPINIGINAQTASGFNSWLVMNIVTSSSTGAEAFKEGVVTIPDDAVRFRAFIQIGGWPTFAGILKVRRPVITKMTNADLIVDGTITADKIDTTDLHVKAANIDGTITFGQLSGVQAAGNYALDSDIPTNVSDLTNDSDFQTSSQVENTITNKGYATNINLTTEINQRKAQYGTCSQAVNDQVKMVTCANFELVAGNELTVKFTTANTYASGTVRLNVNGKGAKNIWVGNAVTSTTNKLLWGANAYITFRYDGTQFIVIGEPRTWYGACTTAEGTAAKTDTTAVTGCVICKGTKVELAMTNANTADAPTLNIQSTGALAIYFGNGTTRPTKAGGTSWLATNTCTFTFDGAAWRTQGKTYIDANSIVTGYISADRIDGGSISIGKLDSNAQNQVFYTYSSGGNTNSYVKLCTIQAAGSYVNRDVTFTISSRGSRMETEVNWAFSNSGTATSTTISHAYATGDVPLYYVGEGNGVYGIYVQKAESYDTLQIHNLYNPHPGSSGIVITWLGTDVASLPAGYVVFTQLAGSRTSASIDNAATTASNYIHADSTGINIYDKSLSNANKYYLRQTAGGTYIYRNSCLKAKYEDTITLYGGSNASGANPKVELSSSDFKMTDNSGIQRLLLNSSDGAMIGRPDKGRVRITDDGMFVYDINSKKRTQVDINGLHLYDTDGSTESAIFSPTSARIGKENNVAFYMNTSSLQAYYMNGNTRTKYFEVSPTGMTYGPFTAASTADIDAIEIGGRNLIRNTALFKGWTNCGSGTSGTFDTSAGTFTYPAVSVNGWTQARPNANVPYSYVRGKMVVLTAEVKGESDAVINVMVSPYLSTTATGDRSCYRNIWLTPSGGGLARADTTADGTWQKVYAIVDITDSLFNSGTKPSDLNNCYFGARIARLSSNHNAYVIRRVSIQVGNKATDWTPAPEDVDADIFNAEKTATNYIYADGTGIKIASASPGSTNQHIHITASDLKIYDAGRIQRLLLDTNGVTIGQNTTGHVVVTDNGMSVYDTNNKSALFVGMENTISIVRVGRTDSGGNVILSGNGYVDICNAAITLAHFGYGSGQDEQGSTSTAPYYSIGVRKASTTIGNYSLAEGDNTTATGYCSHAEGASTIAGAVCTHAEGYGTTANASYAHAEGQSTVASQGYAHAEGQNTIADGACAHVEGCKTTATKRCAHAEGENTTANGAYAHAEGYGTIVNGAEAHAEGYNTIAGAWAEKENSTVLAGNYTHTEGQYTETKADAAHAEGRNTIAGRWLYSSNGKVTDIKGECAHAEGQNTLAGDTAAHAEGWSTQALAICAHAEGGDTKAWGSRSHVEGDNTLATANAAHAEGWGTQALAICAHAEGGDAIAAGARSHAEGYNTIAGEWVKIGPNSDIMVPEGANSAAAHAEGYHTTASGEYSHAEGDNTTANGIAAHAEGCDTIANWGFAHAEGWSTIAGGQGAHTEGQSTKVYGACAHAEGFYTEGSELAHYCHVEGSHTKAGASCAHAEGDNTTANGPCAHAEGGGTVASGTYSHAAGAYTIASQYAQFVCGTYNATFQNTTAEGQRRFVIGIGTSSTQKANGFIVNKDGSAWVSGTLTQASDRRLKKHDHYLAEDASDFIRKLKPALFEKDGARHLGFYAQNVQEAEPESWNTATVLEEHSDDSLDFDPLALDYSALIAPLVAYTQSLEERIKKLETKIEILENK